MFLIIFLDYLFCPKHTLFSYSCFFNWVNGFYDLEITLHRWLSFLWYSYFLFPRNHNSYLEHSKLLFIIVENWYFVDRCSFSAVNESDMLRTRDITRSVCCSIIQLKLQTTLVRNLLQMKDISPCGFQLAVRFEACLEIFILIIETYKWLIWLPPVWNFFNLQGDDCNCYISNIIQIDIFIHVIVCVMIFCYLHRTILNSCVATAKHFYLFNKFITNHNFILYF